MNGSAEIAQDCPCTQDCPRRGPCAACIACHRRLGWPLVACMQELWDRHEAKRKARTVTVKVD